MSEKEHKEFMAILEKQRREVTTSKVAARKLLNQLGMLTPKGNLKKAFRAAK
ncbi:MAG: hypothetical protein ABIX01_21075 [Chitinophagaceae bacterium]